MNNEAIETNTQLPPTPKSTVLDIVTQQLIPIAAALRQDLLRAVVGPGAWFW
jgi:hypothetical protein